MRDGFRRNESSGSAGVDKGGRRRRRGKGRWIWIGRWIGRSMSNENSDGVGKKCWRADDAGGGAGLDGEVDQDSDWTRTA